MEEGKTELVFTLTMISIFLVIGIVAVYIFFRQWRREHQKQNSDKAKK